MKDQLTSRQDEVLQFITGYLTEHCYPPTHREIQEHFQFKSPRAVDDHLAALEKKGHLVYRGKGARAIEVSGYSVYYDVPVIKNIAENKPILSEENIGGRIGIDSKIAASTGTFFVNAQNDEMRDAGIFKGDYLLVFPAPHAGENDLVAYLLEGKVLIRFFHREGNQIRLYRTAKDDAPIEILSKGDFIFLGKVAAILRLNENFMLKASSAIGHSGVSSESE
jgi:repressor LexA